MEQFFFKNNNNIFAKIGNKFNFVANFLIF